MAAIQVGTEARREEPMTAKVVADPATATCPTCGCPGHPQPRTWEVVCTVCGEKRWPLAVAEPEAYVCARCRDVAGEARGGPGPRERSRRRRAGSGLRVDLRSLAAGISAGVISSFADVVVIVVNEHTATNITRPRSGDGEGQSETDDEGQGAVRWLRGLLQGRARHKRGDGRRLRLLATRRHLRRQRRPHGRSEAAQSSFDIHESMSYI
jgi:hypothetical protein